MVGRAIAAKLAELGHTVTMGTRDPQATAARREGDAYGNPSFAAWQAAQPQIQLGTFAQAAADGELLFNCTAGGGSVAALQSAAPEDLAGKTLVDVANPLDFSHGMPPSLSVCNTDSLAETIQRTFPALKVVKALNTMNANVMVNPALLAGEHSVFVSGNDAAAKAQVTALLRSFGWRAIIDLGDLSTARGSEMVLPLWLSLMGALGTPLFNFAIAR
jgi:predicted dinucleotide-binding enzyme